VSKKIEEILKEFSEIVSKASQGREDINLEDYMRVTNPPYIRQMAISLDNLLKKFQSREQYLKVAVEELKSTRKKLEEMNKELEKKVKERTHALEEANKLLESLSITDPLTGISNRRNFDYELRQEVSRALRYMTKLSCIMFDIDHFKKVNDTYGHLVGDEILKMIGSILKKHLRIHDIPARYGGEEFVVLLPETGLDDAYKVAEKIRDLIKNSVISKNSEKIRITVSLGVAEFDPERMKEPKELVDAADKALYMAKNNGRNRTELYKLP